ncbi:MAG: hypothetical protein K0S20_56 [Patescibacteria group bacterium]|jgi:hypothetical protein|nr:hypothetical protein [Patescibacteria group bacterium]
MAKKENFFLNPVDRTPYAGCAWVAVIVIGLFVILSSLLWKTAGAVKHSSLFHFDSPAKTKGNDLLKQVQDATNGVKPDTEKATEEAKEKVQQSIREEADRQIQNQIDKATEEGASGLKQYFSQ